MELEFTLITLATFIGMEGITWLTHKYVMHGFLWYLHEDHHQPKYLSFFERNDLFFIIFSIPSIALFYYGVTPVLNELFFIGLGILLYGMAYFFIHEIIIHQRIKWFTRTKIRYFVGLRKAHKIHHKHLGKEDGECFGMLNVPSKYFRM